MLSKWAEQQSDLPAPEGRWWHSVVAMLLFVAIVAACILAVFWFD